MPEAGEEEAVGVGEGVLWQVWDAHGRRTVTPVRRRGQALREKA
jgi:hypothetical protein